MYASFSVGAAVGAIDQGVKPCSLSSFPPVLAPSSRRPTASLCLFAACDVTVLCLTSAAMQLRMVVHYHCSTVVVAVSPGLVSPAQTW